MKKISVMLLTFLLLAATLVSCGDNGNGNEETTADEVAVNVTVNVVAGDEKVLDGVVVTLRDAENLTVLAALKQACYAYDIVYDIDEDTGLVNSIGDYKITGGTITETNAEGEEVATKTDVYYWEWSLNNKSMEARANATTVKSGDTVTYSYIRLKEETTKKK